MTDDLSFLAPPGAVSDWRKVVLYDAAAGSGLLEAIDGGALPPAVLAERLGLDRQAVRVVIEALTAWDVIQVEEDGAVVPGSAWPEAGVSASLRHHARAIRSWGANLDDRLRGIRPDQSRRSPPDLGLWLEALAARARQCAPAVVDACRQRLPSARRVLELGGGHGEYGLELARRGLEVTMQDRPEVVNLVRDRLAGAGVTTYAGDLFETMPDGPFDLVFCAGINHTYDAERNQALCHRAAAVTSPGGAIAIVTYLRGRDPMAPTFAVQMLVGGGGGDTHAEDDFRRWLSVAGLAEVEVVDGAHPRESLLLARR